jgi:myo-inositol-1(or 4)-monophosphatase
MQGALNIAIRAARAAGNIMVRYFDRLDSVKVTAKGANDFVTEVDRMCEATVIDTIRKSFPEHAFLAEESGHHAGNDHQWIIDPLDGTLNFLHGFPHFAVSIALAVRGKTEVGVIYDPMRQELFVATRGGGARLDDKRIRTSSRSGLKGALLGTGFPFRETDDVDRYMTIFREFATQTAGMRRPGAAALDLAYVAAGRIDGFFEFGLSPWDMAAGALIAREAGAIVADADGSENYMATGNLVVAPPRMYRAMHPIIGPHFTRKK